MTPADGRGAFIRKYGILRWGVPVALGTALLGHWSVLPSARFFVYLLVHLLITGVIGGWVWGSIMRSQLQKGRGTAAR